jgi:hypothetical protein
MDERYNAIMAHLFKSMTDNGHRNAFLKDQTSQFLGYKFTHSLLYTT